MNEAVRPGRPDNHQRRPAVECWPRSIGRVQRRSSAPADLNHRLQRLTLHDEMPPPAHRPRPRVLGRSRLPTARIPLPSSALAASVEGLLQSVLSERDEHIRVHGFLDDQGKALHDCWISLHYLINLARSRSWIQLDAADFMHKVREYRNYVHLWVHTSGPAGFRSRQRHALLGPGAGGAQ